MSKYSYLIVWSLVQPFILVSNNLAIYRLHLSIYTFVHPSIYLFIHPSIIAGDGSSGIEATCSPNPDGDTTPTPSGTSNSTWSLLIHNNTFNCKISKMRQSIYVMHVLSIHPFSIHVSIFRPYRFNPRWWSAESISS